MSHPAGCRADRAAALFEDWRGSRRRGHASQAKGPHACRPMLKQLMRAPDASLTAVEAAELLHFCFLGVLQHLASAADAPAAA